MNEFVFGLTAVLTLLIILTLYEAKRRRAALLATVARYHALNVWLPVKI